MSGIRGMIRLCVNGKDCVAFFQLGEPARLSRSNTGWLCFRCSERKVDADLETCKGGTQAIALSTIRLADLHL